MADYFKEKLSTKSLKFGTPESEVRPNPDSHDVPKGGLGSAPLGIRNSFVNASHRGSLAGFLSLNSSSFCPSAAPIVNDGSDTSSTNRRSSKAKRKEKMTAEMETATQNNSHPEEPLLEDSGPSSVEERKRLKAERKARKAKKNQPPLQ